MKTDQVSLLSGAMFAGFGVAALSLSGELVQGSAAQMGPGYFPRVLGVLLILFGAAIAAGAARGSCCERLCVAWRPLAALTMATVLFALLLAATGLVVSLLTMTAASRLARPEYGWRETALLSGGVAAMCALVFHVGLGVQVPLWPALG